MEQFPIVQDNAGDEYVAGYFNSSMGELNNAVTSTSQELDVLKTDQLGASMASYAASGNFYIENGSINNYQLQPNENQTILKNYPNGAELRFVPGNSNDGPSTLIVNGLISRPIITIGGSPLEGGEIIAGIITNVYYDKIDENNGNFVLYSTYQTYVTGQQIHGYMASVPGFVKMDDGTIGNAGSGATNRANADTKALYILLYNTMDDSLCPVIGGRSGNADDDFEINNVPITLPLSLGRALCNAGQGSGLTLRTLGEYLGEEEHVLTEDELAAHEHGSYYYEREFWDNGNGYNVPIRFDSGTNNPTTSTGGDLPHNTMQPSSFVNFFIKL